MKDHLRQSSSDDRDLRRLAGRWLSAVLLTLVISGGAVAAGPQQTGQRQQGQKAQPGSTKVQEARALTDADILEAKILLDQLGYWLDTTAAGLDPSLRHALIAFQKIEGRPRTGVLTKAEIEALRAARRPRPLESDYPHIEVDLERQVLFVIGSEGASLRVLPVSSGSGKLFTEDGETRRAVTPTGKFKVYRKIEGWRKSPLGLLYYPNYITDGIAIHGNPAVPAYPASHGCIRIPMFASREFSEIATIGMVVIVYNTDPLP
jgi:lipoprotein-anchoring transpeptidase ErfK/SrfK